MLNCSPIYQGDIMAWLDSEHKLWSQYRFLTQLLKAKKDYYTDGTSKLTDKQYDSLEYSFIVLHSIIKSFLI